VALVTDAAGKDAYLLTSFMGANTDAGTVYQYTISQTGALSLSMSIPIDGAPVSESVQGQDLYVLDADSTGAHIKHYRNGLGGELSLVGSTAGIPGGAAAMAVVSGT
jgi:hypothetical protein